MKTIQAFLLLMVAAMVLVFGATAGFPVQEMRRQERRRLLRLFDARALPMRDRWMLWAERTWHVTVHPIKLFLKYESRDMLARLLSLYCMVTRQEGYEGFTMSYWRWNATITLAFRERYQRQVAKANGDFYFMGAGGPVLVEPEKGWGSVPAHLRPVAGGAITRVGQISPLFYKQVAGGLPVLQDMSVFPGNIYFVDSGGTSRGGTTSGFGTHPDIPITDVDSAIDLCTASQADVIYVLPGHNEDLGAAATATIDADVQGISIIGRGRGPDRPRFDYTEATAEIEIGAHGVHVQNIHLLPSVTVVTIAIDVETTITDTLLEDIEAVPGEAGDGTDEFVTCIETKATCTRTAILGFLYSHHASANGPAQAIHINGISDRVHIKDFWIEITGAAAVAGILFTGISTRSLLEEGVITTDAEPGIQGDGANTGSLKNIYLFCNLATIDAATVLTGMAHFNVRYVEVGNEAGTLVKTESVDD